MDYQLKPLGPEAIRARMEAIRARMAKPTPKAATPETKPDAQGFSVPEDVTTMRTDRPPALAGEITDHGTKPMSPFAPGVQVGGDRHKMFRPMIERAAAANGLDPDLIDAIVEAESDYNPTDVSRTGAKGLMQLMPSTAQEVGVTDPFDPVQNLNGGAAYFAKLKRQFPSLEHAIAAYNAGPGAVVRAGGIPNYSETQRYVKKVMSLYEARKGAKLGG